MESAPPLGKSLFGPANTSQGSPELRSSQDINISKVMDSTLSLSDPPSSHVNTPVVIGGSPVARPF